MKTGEILAILGHNGVGKTTLLKCILGLHSGCSGRIERAQRIGYVPQKTSPVFNMSALEMVVMGRMPYLGLFGMPGKKDYDIARQIAQDLDISDLLELPFNDLSGGQKQMILIARALCAQPAAVLLDEPMSALDYSNQNRVLMLMKDIAKQGMSILFTTHDPTHAAHVAHKVLLMKDSKEYFFGDRDVILIDQNLEDTYNLPLCVHTIQQNTVINPLYDRVLNGFFD